jgi:SAM-dependent methyltransferase
VVHIYDRASPSGGLFTLAATCELVVVAPDRRNHPNIQLPIGRRGGGIMASAVIARAEQKKQHAPQEIGLAGRLLQRFCRPIEEDDYAGGTAKANIDNCLDFMIKTVPDFIELTEGKSVLDLGCGFGQQAAALARRGSRVTGLDLPRDIFRAKWAELTNAYPTLRLTTEVPSELFDVAYSCSAFEHFSDPAHILQLMKERVRPGGKVIITFAEPWLSPRGHHMDGFTKLPWVNLLFPERDVLAVRSLYRSDGATRYEEVEGGLNRMTVARFERLMRESGMSVESLRLYSVKGLPAVTKIPVLRELLTAACSAVLVRPS